MGIQYTRPENATNIKTKLESLSGTDRLSADAIKDGSTNKVYTSTEQSKLSGIAAGAKADHGELSGLADDDHAQYHNNARGDTRYPNISSQSAAPSSTPGKAMDFNLDLKNLVSYIAKGLASSLDWIRTDGKFLWRNLGSAGFSAGQADYTSLAIKSNGMLYIAFSDYSNSQKATVMLYDGNAWVLVGTAGFSAGRADYIVLKFDKNDNPCVLYADYGNSNKLTMMKFTGSAWALVGTAGFSPSAGIEISLAFDTKNTPYVSYRTTGSGKATVMKYDGSSWGLVGSAEFTSTSAGWTNVLLDSTDKPYIAYKKGVSPKGANVMSFDGANWNAVGSADFSAGEAGYLNFAIDSKDSLYVAFRDSANSQKATVMTFNGVSWDVVGTAGFSADEVYYLHLQVDSNDRVYLAYRETPAVGGTVKYANVMKWNGTAWSLVGVRSFSAGHANYVSLAIDGKSNLYVAYQDGANSTKATVMQFLQESANSCSCKRKPTWQSGAPTTIPNYVGELNVDTAGNLYFAKGIASSADWILLANA